MPMQKFNKHKKETQGNMTSLKLLISQSQLQMRLNLMKHQTKNFKYEFNYDERNQRGQK